MSYRTHKKNMKYYEDGCWDYSSKMYNTKKYDKTAQYKHERIQYASTSKDTPEKTIDLIGWKHYYKWGMLYLY